MSKTREVNIFKQKSEYDELITKYFANFHQFRGKNLNLKSLVFEKITEKNAKNLYL